jgi:hypothetical protein
MGSAQGKRAPGGGGRFGRSRPTNAGFGGTSVDR